MTRRLRFLRVVFGRHEIRPEGADVEGIKQALISAIKTGVQVGVAALAAYLLQLGIDIGEASQYLETGLFMGMSAVVAFVFNKLGEKFPWLNQVFSLGLTKAPPTY